MSKGYTSCSIIQEKNSIIFGEYIFTSINNKWTKYFNSTTKSADLVCWVFIITENEFRHHKKKDEQLREQFGLLDAYAQNLVILLLVGHTEASKMSKMKLI